MNSWAETAAKQLFQTWARCGITHFPAPSSDGTSLAAKWLDDLNVAQGVEDARSMGVHPGPPNSSVAHASAVVAPNISGLDRPTTFAPHPISSGSAPPTSSQVTGSNAGSLAGSSMGAALPPSSRLQSKPASPQLGTQLTQWESSPQDLDSRLAFFQQLKQDVNACRKCAEIVCRRQNTVFGIGPANAKIVMFGEAPGAEEDRVGEPFIGAAGQLMDKILVATGLKRDEVFIMNSLKCRPPNNRTPVDTEIENCRPFFESQLETIQPDYIVCWGSVAVRAILRSTESVGRLRGRFHQYKGAKVLVTYHPAYLLRNPDAKKLTWEDMKLLMRELGIPIPPPKR